MLGLRILLLLLIGICLPPFVFAADDNPFGDDSDAAPTTETEDDNPFDDGSDAPSPVLEEDVVGGGDAVPMPPLPKPDVSDADPVVAKWNNLLDRIDQIDELGGSLEEALPLAKEALAIAEKRFGPNDANTGLSLEYLADMYAYLGNVAAAEPLYKRAVKICKRVYGPESIEYANSLAEVAILYHETYRYDDAAPLYKQSIEIATKALGDPNHPNLALTLNNLADVYYRQGRGQPAEALQKQAIAAYAKAEEIDAGEKAFYLIGLSHIHRALGKNPMRVWNDDSGKHQRKGAFVGLDIGKIIMKLEDGKQSSIPLNRLSQGDKDYVLLEWSASPRATAADIQALLAAKADANTRDQHGQTPLHLAAYSSNDPKIISVLLDADAYPIAEDNADILPLDNADQNLKMIDTPEYQKLEAVTQEELDNAANAIPLPPTPKPDA